MARTLAGSLREPCCCATAHSGSAGMSDARAVKPIVTCTHTRIGRFCKSRNDLARQISNPAQRDESSDSTVRGADLRKRSSLLLLARTLASVVSVRAETTWPDRSRIPRSGMSLATARSAKRTCESGQAYSDMHAHLQVPCGNHAVVPQTSSASRNWSDVLPAHSGSAGMSDLKPGMDLSLRLSRSRPCRRPSPRFSSMPAASRRNPSRSASRRPWPVPVRRPRNCGHPSPSPRDPWCRAL